MSSKTEKILDFVIPIIIISAFAYAAYRVMGMIKEENKKSESSSRGSNVNLNSDTPTQTNGIPNTYINNLPSQGNWQWYRQPGGQTHPNLPNVYRAVYPYDRWWFYYSFYNPNCLGGRC